MVVLFFGGPKYASSERTNEDHGTDTLSRGVAPPGGYRGGDVGPWGLVGISLVLHSSSSVGETEVCCCTGLGALDGLCFVEKY